METDKPKLPLPEYLAGPKGPVKITPAQTRILESLAQGNKLTEAAKALHINQSTVNVQMHRLCNAVGARHWFDLFLRWFNQRTAQAIWPRSLPEIAPPEPRHSPLDNCAAPRHDTGDESSESEKA